MDQNIFEAFVIRGQEVLLELKLNPMPTSNDEQKDSLFDLYTNQVLDMEGQMGGVHPSLVYVPPNSYAATDQCHLPPSISFPVDPRQSFSRGSFSRRASRNPSLMALANGLRHTSMTSETTFGRAMSGLSALSIDWENLDDFDLEVDHSAHINNQARHAAAENRAEMIRRGGGGDGNDRVSFKI
jgi:hypothetical protein